MDDVRIWGIKNVLFLFVFFFAGFNGLKAQSRDVFVHGRIINAVSGVPVENVNVMIPELSKGSITDKQGLYKINGIKKGSYTLRVSSTGYKTENVDFVLEEGKDTKLDLMLRPQVYPIDSVVVTAQKDIRDLLVNPYTEPFSLLPSITVIKSSDIRKQGAITVIDALNHVPGGLTETRGRQVKQFFSVRGQKYPYPDYALNGIWQQEFEELPYFFSAADIEEIEIIRSSAALLTGLSGMEGLINIKTKDYRQQGTNAEIEYGTFNSFHSNASKGGQAGSIGYHAGIGYDSSEGPSGKHAKENMTHIHAGLEWEISPRIDLKTTVFFLDGSRELRIAEPPADKKYRDFLQRFDPYRALISNLKFSYRISENASAEVQLFHTFRNPVFMDEVKKSVSREKDYETGINFMQSLALSSRNTLRFGGLYNHWVAPEGKRFYIGRRCDTETFSGVVVDEHQAGHFIFDAGIRWTKTYLNEYAAFNIEGEGGQFRNVTPLTDIWEPAIFQGSLGATWRYDNFLSLCFNAAAGEIQPRRGTLNQNLEEPENEKRVKMDLGLIKKFRTSGKMTLTAFSVLQKDAIALSGTTYADPATGHLRELYLNRGQFQRGIEYEITAPVLFRMLSPYLNFTLMKSEMKKDGEMTINRENPVFISSCGLYFEKRRADVNLFAKYVSRFENERFAPASAGPQPLGDFISIDLTGGYIIHPGVPLRLYIKVKNLTDKRFSTVTGYPDYGRMIFAGMSFNFTGRQKNE